MFDHVYIIFVYGIEIFKQNVNYVLHLSKKLVLK